MSAQPEPKLTDFTCKQCRAQVGEPCRSVVEAKRLRGHATRQDKLIRALADWRVARAETGS
jgi:hypothetical protein